VIDFSFIHSILFDDMSQLIIAHGRIIQAYSKFIEISKEGTFENETCAVVTFNNGVAVMKLKQQKIIQVISGDYNIFYSAVLFCFDIIREMNSVDSFNKNKIEFLKKSMEAKKNGSND